MRRLRTDQERGYERAMVEASCHCGSVSLEIDAPPSEVAGCDCPIRRRHGVLWAYHPPDRARVPTPGPPTGVYAWDGGSIGSHRRRNRGRVSRWAAADRGRMGVNARLADPEVLAAARVRHPDGADTERYTD